jgi:hypothetical protein
MSFGKFVGGLLFTWFAVWLIAPEVAMLRASNVGDALVGLDGWGTRNEALFGKLMGGGLLALLFYLFFVKKSGGGGKHD